MDYTVRITMEGGEVVDEIIYNVYDSPNNELAIRTALNLIHYAYDKVVSFELIPRR